MLDIPEGTVRCATVHGTAIRHTSPNLNAHQCQSLAQRRAIARRCRTHANPYGHYQSNSQADSGGAKRLQHSSYCHRCWSSTRANAVLAALLALVFLLEDTTGDVATAEAEGQGER